MSLIPEEIIIKSLQHTATEEEARILNEWMRENPQHVEIYFQMEEIWHSRSKLTEEAIYEGWDRLNREIQCKPYTNAIIPRSKKRYIWVWIRYVAAIFIGILIASVSWLVIPGKSGFKTITVQNNVVYSRNGVEALALPDGSQVWLNGNSKISYPGHFTAKKRLVHLEGKAFFDVRKNLELPFIVRLGNIDVEVTGTEFFIETGSGGNAQVTLISGSVNLTCMNAQGDKISTRLVPGQEAIINRQSGKIGVTDVDTSYFVAWKDGTYRFVDEPLETIAGLLAKHYGLDIRISSSLRSKRFTGRVTPDDSIKDVMETIRKSYPITYQIDGKIVIISDL